MTTGTDVVRIAGVSKRFVIHKEKSLKERLVNFRRSKAHKDDFWALRGVDITIQSGTTVGLIGPNGSGKSTLLKLIGGVLQPTTGTIERRGRLAALIELGAGFHPDLTGRENVYLNTAIMGMNQEQTDAHFDSIVEFSGIGQFLDTQVKFYSSGMYVRLAFAVAVHVEPDVLLVDEVLAVGDEPFQRKCMDRIRTFQEEGRTIILVSHALDQVAEICDRAIVLEQGKVVVDGEPKEALRRLRGDFEATRTADREREQQYDEGPAGHAKVLSVEVSRPGGELVSEIDPGDDIELTVRIDGGEKLTGWMIGLGLYTPLGQRVWGTNTTLMGLTMPPVSGEETFRFSLPGLWAARGDYTFYAAVSRDSGVEIDKMTDAAPLRVTGTEKAIGYVNCVPELLGL